MGHLQDNGFEVIVDKKKGFKVDNDKLDLNIPAALWSCHTAFVDDYVIEGHVPAADVKNMLEKKLRIRGLSVPGMKLGPPGMEGTKPLPFKVFQFYKHDRVGLLDIKILPLFNKIKAKITITVATPSRAAILLSGPSGFKLHKMY